MKKIAIYNCDRLGLGKLMSAGDFHFLIVQKGDMMEGHVLQIKIAHFPFSHGLTGTNRCPEGRWLANMFQKISRGEKKPLIGNRKSSHGVRRPSIFVEIYQWWKGS